MIKFDISIISIFKILSNFIIFFHFFQIIIFNFSILYHQICLIFESRIFFNPFLFIIFKHFILFIKSDICNLSYDFYCIHEILSIFNRKVVIYFFICIIHQFLEGLNKSIMMYNNYGLICYFNLLKLNIIKNINSDLRKVILQNDFSRERIGLMI